MLTFEKVLKVFQAYLEDDPLYEVVQTSHGYTLMAWEPHRNDWYSAEIQKTPEDLRNALLGTCAKSRTNDSLYHLIACMIFLSGTFSLVLHQRFIFEASMFWGWIGFYVLSIILLGKTLQLYLKKEKMIGELIWNLQ